MREDDRIERLAGLAGVLSGYRDQAGRMVETSAQARRAVLEGLGFPTGASADVDAGLERLRALREAPLARVIACTAQSPVAISLRGALRTSVHWALEQEDGSRREGECDLRHSRFDLPALPIGYHRLSVRIGAAQHNALLVASPPQCWRPPQLEERKAFGVTAQIYSLRSDRQFGIGDYTDVGDLAQGASCWGASFLGLSPAHALFPADPTRFSPYSPSSRLFLQTALIDPATAAEGAAASFAALIESAGLRPQLENLRKAPLIDYAGVWSLKGALFDILWTRFGGENAAGFEAFRRERGEPLEQHATFDALSEHFVQSGGLWSGAWPTAYQQVDSAAVAQFRKENSERVAFHAWLQWIADRQLAEAHARARDAGMEVGLYRDLAVGPDRAGSEVWSAPSRYAKAMSIGAPPDPLGPQGQDWGLPPFDPFALEERDLRPFRDLVVANMRHAGALRIDHAFQLQRLFLIPAGAAAALGAYVSYPFEPLLGVLRIESHRAKCLVIAEDLGTSPRGFSDAIMRSGIFSYRLLSFERDETGGFAAPASFPRDALAAINTHDLPTFAGWWRGLDVDLRECFGVFDSGLASAERAARAVDRNRFDEALRREKLPSSGAEGDERAPAEGCLRYLARTSSLLAAVQIEDAISEVQQANLPGPSTGHPNWRRRLSRTIDEIIAPGGALAKTGATLAREDRGLRDPPSRLAAPAPRATYRLQFNKTFTFDHATAIVPYLHALGISHVYASPITKACAGSMHGYDVVDYDEINPELGGMPAFKRFSDALLALGMGLIVDFVPNHMGVASNQNSWWESVLEWGEASPHAKAFDIDWRRPGADGKLLLPFLGKPFSQALTDHEFSLRFDPGEGAFSFATFGQSFPMRPDLAPEILHKAMAGARSASGLLESAMSRFRALSEVQGEALLSASAAAKQSLVADLAARPALGRALAGALAPYNSQTEFGRRALKDLLARQHYRLAFWRLASSELNYRRFFDISTLAGVRVEDEAIFARMHGLIFELVREKRIQGLRIDHIDGLTDPATYLERVQSAAGPGFYVIVEKILESGERLPNWPIAGTTGYETIGALDQLFVDSDRRTDFESVYEEATGDRLAFKDQLFETKRITVAGSFGSELQALTGELDQLARAQSPSLDLSGEGLRRALVALIAAFPVYRTYMTEVGSSEQDRAVVAQAIEHAKARLEPGDQNELAFILGQFCAAEAEPRRQRFVARFQQLTGPAMAKSLEDTVFYRYGRALALNEVGGDPSRFGESIPDFHAAMAERARAWPSGLSATATHDTKRGEDARGRLLAATASPAAWRDGYRVFCDALGTCPQRPDGRDCYILYQSLLAALPIELMQDQPDGAAADSFLRRAKQFVTKALRESKRNTSWLDPNHAYESAVASVLEALLAAESDFLRMIAPLARDLAVRGAHLGVARTVLKCALPGVPDFYQGTEFWDYSFVDPDNRRPVDYPSRRVALESPGDPEIFLRDWQDGRVKQFVTARLLADRAASPLLYASGSY
ncbi:MAG TPA: malto-oligosyltrehalose synthase, partial [Beijerinckiaceae bacterium]|nr:malto-oligosyltrehalose synthase [Beijerinckiaceae bacterium]